MSAFVDFSGPPDFPVLIHFLQQMVRMSQNSCQTGVDN